MLKLVGVNDTGYVKYFCIKDEGVDEELEFITEFELKSYLGSGMLPISDVSLNQDGSLSYSDSLIINNLSDSSDEDEYEDEDYEDDDDYIIDDEDYEEDIDDGIDYSDEDEYTLDEDSEDDYADDGIDYDDDDSYFLDDDDDEDEEDGTINKLYDMLNPQQVDLLKRYYLWFSERTFTKAQRLSNSEYANTLNINKRIDYRNMKLDTLNKMKGDENWRYAGWVHYRHKGDIECSVQMPSKVDLSKFVIHKLRNAHIVWKLKQITEKVETDILEQVLWGRSVYASLDEAIYDGQEQGNCLVFGEKCLSDFFRIPPEGMKVIRKGQSDATHDMMLLYNIMTSDKYQEAMDSFKLGDELFTEFEVIDMLAQMIGEGRIFKYDKLISFYKEFRGLDGKSVPMLPPKTLIQELRDSLLDWDYHNFKGKEDFLAHRLSDNSKLFDYLNKLYGGKLDGFLKYLRSDEPTISHMFLAKVKTYLEILFTYEICGFYKYTAVGHRTAIQELKKDPANKGKSNKELDELLKGQFFSDDEGGCSSAVQKEFKLMYYGVESRFLKDIEYSKNYLDKLVDALSDLPETTFDAYTCKKSDNDAEVIPCKIGVISEKSQFGRYHQRIMNQSKLDVYFSEKGIIDYKPLEEYLFGKSFRDCGRISFRNNGIDDIVQYLGTVKSLYNEHVNSIKDWSLERANKNAQDYKNQLEEQKAEEERLAKEHEEAKESETRKLIEKQEEEKESTVTQQNFNTYDTPNKVIEFLSKEDLSKLTDADIQRVDLMRNILNSVTRKKGIVPSEKQWFWLKKLFEGYTGHKYNGDEIKSTGVAKTDVPQDVIDKLNHLVQNRNSLAKNSDDEQKLFDIITTVSKTGKASERQQTYVNRAVEIYNERVQV